MEAPWKDKGNKRQSTSRIDGNRMVKAAKKNIIAEGSVLRVTTSTAKDAIAEAKRRPSVISTAKEVILEAKKQRPVIIPGTVCCTEGDNVVAIGKVSGQK